MLGDLWKICLQYRVDPITGFWMLLAHRSNLVKVPGVDEEQTEPLWRMARIRNPRNGGMANVIVDEDGRLTPSDRRRTGVEWVAEWYEIRARDRPLATQRLKSGKGIRRRRGSGPSIHPPSE